MDSNPASFNTYAWKGTDANGIKLNGEISAINEAMVQSELQTAGIVITKLKRKPKPLFSFLKKKIRFSDIVFFSRYLATVLNAKVPLVQALDIIAGGQENIAMQTLIKKIKADVESGNSFSAALKKYPNYFDNLYCGLVHSGEQSGTLEVMLNRLADHLENVQSLKRKVKKALVYPVVIVTTALGVSAVMLVFIVPQFEALFKTHDAQLPAFTRGVIAISNAVQAYWYIIILILVAGIIAFRYFNKHSKKFSHNVDKLALRLPVFGVLLKKIIYARFTSTLAVTLGSGMLIIDALSLVKEVVKNSIYSDAIGRITNDVVKGQQMYMSMAITNLFPNMIVKMVEIGEKTGEMQEMLQKISEYYEEEVDYTVSNMSSILEPFVIIFLGGIVAVLVISMYLPIFELGSIY